jgi:hypothetical protein
MGVGREHHNTATLSWEKDPVPIVRETGWAPGPVHAVWKILPSLGFDLQTVQPVVNRYSDYAHNKQEEDEEFLKLAHKVVSSTCVYEMSWSIQ